MSWIRNTANQERKEINKQKVKTVMHWFVGV
jgi:hypothetical protein